MTTPAPTVPPTVLAQLDEARATCRELMNVLREETAHLNNQKIEVLEERLELKRHLTLRLERLVHGLKNLKAEWRNDRRNVNVAHALAVEMGEFQRLAAKNMLQLQAAHQVRGDVIGMIKDTFEAHQAPLGYGKDGSLTRSTGNTVLRKEI